MSKQQSASGTPDIQLFCNLVIRREKDDAILLEKHDPDDDRWWLPAADLEPYEHPDDAARRAVEAIAGITVTRSSMVQVQSFRGRRGWHVTFDYLVVAGGEPKEAKRFEWFPMDALPRTAHGNWEQDLIRKVIGREN